MSRDKREWLASNESETIDLVLHESVGIDTTASSNLTCETNKVQSEPSEPVEPSDLPKSASYSELETVDIPDDPCKFDIYTIDPGPIYHKLPSLMDDPSHTTMDQSGSSSANLFGFESQNPDDLQGFRYAEIHTFEDQNPLGGVSSSAVFQEEPKENLIRKFGVDDYDMVSYRGRNVIEEDCDNINKNINRLSALVPDVEMFGNEQGIDRKFIEKIVSENFGSGESSKNKHRVNSLIEAMKDIDMQSILQGHPSTSTESQFLIPSGFPSSGSGLPAVMVQIDPDLANDFNNDIETVNSTNVQVKVTLDDSAKVILDSLDFRSDSSDFAPGGGLAAAGDLNPSDGFQLSGEYAYYFLYIMSLNCYGECSFHFLYMMSLNYYGECAYYFFCILFH